MDGREATDDDDDATFVIRGTKSSQLPYTLLEATYCTKHPVGEMLFRPGFSRVIKIMICLIVRAT